MLQKSTGNLLFMTSLMTLFNNHFPSRIAFKCVWLRVLSGEAMNHGVFVRLPSYLSEQKIAGDRQQPIHQSTSQ